MTRRCTLLLLLILIVNTSGSGEDWPQWMGPGRDNIWREDGIIDKFPDGGPKVVWRTQVAGGYAGPAVAAGRVFVTDYVTADNVKVDNFDRKPSSGSERVICLAADSGVELWKHAYPVEYRISYPAGPRCTPTVDQDRVYVLGAVGHLLCLKAETGDIVWSKDLTTEYGTTPALWGYTGHPLVDGEKLICVVGGSGSHVVAFDKQSGRELWRAITANEQGYSPPTIIEAGGVRQLILLRPDAVSSVDPETGRQYWSVPYEATSGSIIMSPIHWDNYLYAAGYSNKNILLKLDDSPADAEVVWQDKWKHGLSPVNVQPFLDGNLMYGFDQSGWLYCVEFPSGKRLWKTAEPIGQRPQQTGTAFIMKQADRFWLFNELGELIIARLSADGYEEIDRTKLLEPTNNAFGRPVVWSNPAYANRRAYVRNDQEIICVDLSK